MQKRRQIKRFSLCLTIIRNLINWQFFSKQSYISDINKNNHNHSRRHFRLQGKRIHHTIHSWSLTTEKHDLSERRRSETERTNQKPGTFSRHFRRPSPRSSHGNPPLNLYHLQNTPAQVRPNTTLWHGLEINKWK